MDAKKIGLIFLLLLNVACVRTQTSACSLPCAPGEKCVKIFDPPNLIIPIGSTCMKSCTFFPPCSCVGPFPLCSCISPLNVCATACVGTLPTCPSGSKCRIGQDNANNQAKICCFPGLMC